VHEDEIELALFTNNLCKLFREYHEWWNDVCVCVCV
jgi:hypothetical protein